MNGNQHTATDNGLGQNGRRTPTLVYKYSIRIPRI